MNNKRLLINNAKVVESIQLMRDELEKHYLNNPHDENRRIAACESTYWLDLVQKRNKNKERKNER